ncbi:glycosyltransferase family 2 protein [Haladaptatus sp. GCM10025893]|uniref:glycosyltransferase family 2 protein n=1 Tax=Haladaptatus sp. GCM10025893 TaxID=3252659 RepID=UPI003619B40A
MTTFDTLPARYRSLVARTTAVTIPEHEILATVVVVLYRTDRAAFETTLAALDAQTADAFDVIVVDNGTTWDVPAVLAGSRRVRTYVELTGNHGVTVARNQGRIWLPGHFSSFSTTTRFQTPTSSKNTFASIE